MVFGGGCCGGMCAQVIDIWHQVAAEAQSLADLALLVKKKIELVQRELVDHRVVLTHEGMQNFGLLRRILSSLDERIQIVGEYLSSGTSSDIMKALGLLKQPLVIANDTLNRLLDEEPIRPIARSELRGILMKLLNGLEFVEQPLAAKRQSVSSRPHWTGK